ncbi:MAG: hypothetical protein P9M06_05060 [Candidatus Saelkia tenebricola]|nr:hypothetical protein [Candidatus Saelkia tenebricola]
MRIVFRKGLIFTFLSLLLCGILSETQVIFLNETYYPKGESMSARRARESVSINSEDLAIEVQYIMDMLGIVDTPRIVQIIKTSIDPVAFVGELSRVSGQDTEQVLSLLDGIDFFSALAADYRVRTAESIDPSEFDSQELNVSISAGGYASEGGIEGSQGQSVTDFLDLKSRLAASVPFVFRDDMVSFMGRFLGLSDISAQATPDLFEIVDVVADFLSKLNLADIRYVLSSGIGANEMYSHQLSEAVNAYFISQGVDFEWIVVNNPAHLGIIPDGATNENTIVFEMSRSGSTRETIHFFDATKNRFQNRIVVANKGDLKDAAIALSDQEGANVLIIDNTPGDIGGRQMNRKTLMVYAPLFVALSAGSNDINKGIDYLEEYCEALYNANSDLDYGSDVSSAVNLAEFLFRQRASGRNKFSVVFDSSLADTATELFQLLNEGGNKNIAGGSNNNILVSYDLAGDRSIYETVFNNALDTQLPIFLLDQSLDSYETTLAYVEELRASGIPCIVLSVNMSEDLDNNLGVLARTSALLQDMVVYYTYITNQDANSNPAVKFVREITSAMFEILEEKRASGDSDVRMSFEDVVNKINEQQELAHSAAEDSISAQGVARVASVNAAMVPLTDALSSLSRQLSIADRFVATALVGSISSSVIRTDVGEAGGSKIQEIDVAFRNASIWAVLGQFTPDLNIPSLSQQVVLADTENTRVSVAVEQDSQIDISGSTLAEQIAAYLGAMYQDRGDTLEQLSLTYMEVDSDNPIIGEIAQIMVDAVASENITCPLLGLPGVAHQGIEAIMSHPTSIFNIAIVYTNTYGEGLGTQQIDDIVTVDDATYVYGISNVARMALGGTPSVIFEVKNGEDLEMIRDVLGRAMMIFRTEYLGN